MTKEAVELLANYGGEPYEDYLGKGMSNPTQAIVFDDQQEFFKALGQVITDCIEDNERENGEFITKALKDIRIDSLGKDIIYY